MDGYETAKRLKAIKSDVIIIAQTAYARPDDQSKFIDKGFDDYISKPLKINDIRKPFAAYLNGL